MVNQNQNSNSTPQIAGRGELYYLLFLINPFLGLLAGLSNLPSVTIVRVIIILTATFFGGTFVVGSAESDAYVHVNEFKAIDTDQPFDEYVMHNLEYHGDGLLFGLKYVVRLFTDDGAIFFAILGLLYGLIVGRSVTLILFNLLNIRYLSKVMVLAIVYIFFIYSLTSLNAVRFPIAAHFYLLGVIYAYKRRLGWAIVCMVLAGFSHVGLWLAVLLFALVYILGKRMFPVYLLFLVISSLPLNLASETFSQLSPTSEIKAIEKRKNYMSDEYLSQAKIGLENKNWYVNLRFKYVLSIINIIIIYLAFRYYKKLKDSQMIYLLMLGILLISTGQFLEWTIHSFRRYYMVGQMVVLIPIIDLISERMVYVPKLLIQNLTFGMIFFLIIEIRVFFYNTTIDFLISNPFISFFYKSQIPLNDFIK